MKKSRYDEIKYAIRKLEGIVEVAVLVLVYYFMWKQRYSVSDGDFFMEEGNICSQEYTQY